MNIVGREAFLLSVQFAGDFVNIISKLLSMVRFATIF
jgi:hypothetical protein